jgi:hypothetical protein
MRQMLEKSVQNLKWLMWEPDRLFVQFKEKANWKVPMVVVMVILPLLGVIFPQVATGFASVGDYIEYYMKIAVETGAEATEASLQARYYTDIVMQGFGILFIWLFKAWMCGGLANAMDGEGQLKQAFSIVAWSYLPVAFAKMITMITAGIFGSGLVFNLGFLMPASMESSFLYLVLRNIDLFVIWYQVLVIRGLQVVYGVEKRFAIFIGLATWFAYIGMNIGFTILSWYQF